MQAIRGTICWIEIIAAGNWRGDIIDMQVQLVVGRAFCLAAGLSSQSGTNYYRFVESKPAATSACLNRIRFSVEHSTPFKAMSSSSIDTVK
jgi:hypothetical protein